MEIEKYCESSPVHASDDTSNDTLHDNPVLDLQTLTPTHIRRVHLQRHPVWRQPGLGSANPDPYTHHTTPPTTPCVTAPPATNPQNLRTLTPQLEVRTPRAKAIWGNMFSKYTSICPKYKSILSKYKNILSKYSTPVYFQRTKCYFQSTKGILSKYTSTLSKYKSILS